MESQEGPWELWGQWGGSTGRRENKESTATAATEEVWLFLPPRTALGASHLSLLQPTEKGSMCPRRPRPNPHPGVAYKDRSRAH